MATTISAMSYTPFSNNACGEPDIDSWLDFSAIGSPSINNNNNSSGNSSTTLSQPPPSASASTMTSPSTTILPLDQQDDLQTPAKPSHEYERFKQQTGLPSNSVPGLQSLGGSHSQVFSNSGIGFDDNSLMSGTWGSNSGLDMNMDMDFSGPSTVDSFFFTQESTQSDDFVDPSDIQQEEPQTRRYFPGVHQQRAALAQQQQQQQQRQQQFLQMQKRQRALEQQQQQRRRSQPASGRRPGSHQPTDAHAEETIARVVNQIRKSSQASQDRLSPSGGLPHVSRSRKDEEDMDEDERLLASEEGKKLSSKERRQLRNKVSARAFRSRRKEYIGQLEGEVAQKVNEAAELKIQNRALMEENVRSRAFIEKLLRHPAFTPFLEELSRDESLQQTKPPAQMAPRVPAPKDPSPFAAPQQEDLTVGMAMIPEPQIDLSALNLNNNWGVPSTGFGFSQPQVFAVTEVPEGPANPVDVNVLSGKSEDALLPALPSIEEEQAESSELKYDFPIIERREVQMSERSPAPQAKRTDADIAFDNDPAFTLYAPAPTPAHSSSAPIAFDNDEDAEQALERMFARAERVYGRMQHLTSHLDM